MNYLISPTPGLVFSALRSLVLLVLVIPATASVRAGEPPVPPERSSLSASALRDCLGKAASGNCLDQIFRDFLADRSTKEALAAIKRYQESDADLRLSCHVLVHSVGRESFRRPGTIHGAFSACDQTCHSGCYHGAVERFLWGELADAQAPPHVTQQMLKARAHTACAPELALRLRFQCLHGLGHAVLHFAAYRLKTALEICDTLPDVWSRRSCYGGVFMENITAAVPERRDLSPTDYHYPCSQLDAQYRSDCYMMQTSRMAEMGLTLQNLFQECVRAGAYAEPCIQSIGRDLANEARLRGADAAAASCELAAGKARQDCIRGAAYALIDYTWDGQYALPFCNALSNHESSRYCFEQTIRHLRNLVSPSTSELRSQCEKYAGGREACLLASSW
ncbi:MAG: hypothetical protein ACREQK_06840 [Candidatus Binatia bacterium]